MSGRECPISPTAIRLWGCSGNPAWGEMSMSEESWKEEFYPVSAGDLAATKANDLSLVEHSLQKWKGLRQENLDKHDLLLPPIKVNAVTCALCQVYYPSEESLDDDAPFLPCTGCPLFEHLGQRCDTEGASPYGYYSPHDPGSEEPMIACLETVLRKLD